MVDYDPIYGKDMRGVYSEAKVVTLNEPGMMELWPKVGQLR